MPAQSQNRRGQGQAADQYDPDTIRMLVATDNHVGYNERDAIRGDDSWKSFHEIMTLAKERDVDMVLLAGDLFHENKPSRKSMYQVMRSLRMNCLGDKPCELEMLSDASEHFAGAFDHVNYEDPDINVAIPVFSIHGNHDDPSGEGHLAALDLLQVSGLVNYYGRTPESDNIQVKPLLLQKGRTKLALYGMSNVRDERLFRTFRDGNVKFFRPSTQQDEWFNLMSVHQNHHTHSTNHTDYLPENFLPEFLDLVIWGHEHECLIDPTLNAEMGFRVMQPGSSVATSLMPGEAVPKHVAILSIKGKEFKSENIRLKTVRPFIMKEIVLEDEPAMQDVWKKDNNRPVITRHLISIVEELIEQAKEEWIASQGSDLDEDEEMPLPLVRLRVEYSAPDDGKFDCENPQRFSNRFVGKVANIQDVVQFYRAKKKVTRRDKKEVIMPDENVLARLTLDNVKVEKLVREFLTAQSLTILPQNSFGDAVAQFVDKDDKFAMEAFVNESLASQMKHLLSTEDEEMDEEAIQEAMDKYRAQLEELFAAGQIKPTSGRKTKPKPDNWDSDMDGHWADQPGAVIHDEDTPMDDDDSRLGSVRPKPAATRGRGNGRGRGRGGRGAAASSSRATTTAAKKAPAKGGRGKKARSPTPEDDDEEEENDVIMISDGNDDDDDDDESDAEDLFTRPTKKPASRSTAASSSKKAPAASTRTRKAASPAKKASTTSSRSTRAPASSSKRQTQLNFSQPESLVGTQRGRGASSRNVVDDDIEDDDEDDAFEPAAPSRGGRRR
ncbi:double-strand break repair protein mus-23 [Phyllosticta capitalensis]